MTANAASDTKSKPRQLHIQTPLVRSASLSGATSNDIRLKMDTIQPGGSFKIRGHGHLVSTLHARGVTHFVSSSGGNAGMAVAVAGAAVSANVTIVVPETTPSFMVRRLREAGAIVEIHGAVWDQADVRARQIASDGGDACVHVSPFDDPLLWDGHASIVSEIAAQLGGEMPSAIVVSVGGGGLFLGVVEGLRRLGWQHVPVIAAETEGADSFHRMFVNAGQVVRLDEITSIAKSLGALAVSESCAQVVREGKQAVESIVVSDKDAVDSCAALAVEHRVLVEPACGAAVAAARRLGLRKGPVVVVVCGGNMASPGLLSQWVRVTGAQRESL